MKICIAVILIVLVVALIWPVRKQQQRGAAMQGSLPSDYMEAESDPQRRAMLLDRIGDINDFSRPRPLVTLEEFFEGNNDYGSIGYNLYDQPAPATIFDIFRTIRDREDVETILVEVMDLEDPEGWPSSEMVWIITSALPEQVKSWIPERIRPDEVVTGFDATKGEKEQYSIPSGMRAIGLWWD